MFSILAHNHRSLSSVNEKRVLFSYGFELNLSHVTWVKTSPTSWVTSTYGWNNSQFSKRETSSLYKHRCLKTIGKLCQPSQNSPTARSSFREKSGCGRASMQNSSQTLFSFFSCFFLVNAPWMPISWWLDMVTYGQPAADAPAKQKTPQELWNDPLAHYC